MAEYRKAQTEAFIEGFLAVQKLKDELEVVKAQLRDEQAAREDLAAKLKTARRTASTAKRSQKALQDALVKANEALRKETERRQQLEEQLRALEQERSLVDAASEQSVDVTPDRETAAEVSDAKKANDSPSVAEAQSMSEAVPAPPQPVTRAEQRVEENLVHAKPPSKEVGRRRQPSGPSESGDRASDLSQSLPEDLNERPEFRRDNIHPIFRGGARHRRDGETKVDEAVERERARDDHRADALFYLACWFDNWAWHVSLVAAHEGVTCSGAVEQEAVGGRWRILSLDESITVTRRTGSNTEVITVNEQLELPLVFRLTGDFGEGRRVRSVSQGTYLVIHDIEENLDEIDPTCMQTVDVSLEGCRALLVIAEDANTITALPDDVRSGRPLQNAIALAGDILYQEEPPTLFSAPPTLKVLDLREWQRVQLIVLGEEGPGRYRWRTSFRPQANVLEQALPPSLHKRQHGWYFLRFYGYEELTQRWQLLHSDHFRFVSQLQAIDIDRPALLSHNDSPMTVTFKHREGCDVEPASQHGAQRVVAVREEENDLQLTIYRWIPSPAAPKLSFDIRIHDFQTKIAVRARRAWWAISPELPSDLQWGTSVATLSRSDFLPTSETKLWVRLSEERLVERLEVGIEQMRAVGIRDQLCEVPLRNFTDSVQYGREVQSLKLRLPDGDQVVVAELRTLIRCSCCLKELPSIKASTRHLQSLLSEGDQQHLDHFFPALNYDEIRKRQPNRFPFRIFKCSYCDTYTQQMHQHVVSAQADMETHVSTEHRGLEVAYHAINDAKRIREHVLHNLPNLRRCRFCDREFEVSDVKTKGRRHLFEEHENELWEVS